MSLLESDCAISFSIEGGNQRVFHSPADGVRSTLYLDSRWDRAKVLIYLYRAPPPTVPRKGDHWYHLTL